MRDTELREVCMVLKIYYLSGDKYASAHFFHRLQEICKKVVFISECNYEKYIVFANRMEQHL